MVYSILTKSLHGVIRGPEELAYIPTQTLGPPLAPNDITVIGTARIV